ncbi:hypothetical protein [uncultured Dokdonia sp.]|uniref:hypothetical protein n=1 Tax=uncultured Dokdonia sp. TaxID=575653 RepID=UPI00261DB3EC|nr:hypothetical protein [uncultured Dokdonia sp.]
MVDYLNKLEFAIIQEVFKSKTTSKENLFLLEYLPFLKVVERDFTGVGLYVKFDYDNIKQIEFNENLNANLSSNKSLKFDSFEEYFSFELSIDKGKFNYIEIVTYDDGWDGKYDSFSFED